MPANADDVANIVPCLGKCNLGRLIEPLENIDLYWTGLTTTNIIQDTVDRLLGIVAGHSGLGV